MRESSSPNDFINKAVVVKYFFENGPNEIIHGWPNMNDKYWRRVPSIRL